MARAHLDGDCAPSHALAPRPADPPGFDQYPLRPVIYASACAPTLKTVCLAASLGPNEVSGFPSSPCGNICFGGPKRNRRLFMAASQSLYAVASASQGHVQANADQESL